MDITLLCQIAMNVSKYMLSIYVLIVDDNEQ